MNERSALSRLLWICQILWIGGLLFYATYYGRQRWAEFVVQDWQLRSGWFATAALLALLRRLCGGWRWTLLAVGWRADGPTVGHLGHLRVYFLSNLAAYLPGGVWYVPSRVHMSRVQGLSAGRAAVAVAYEIGLLVWTGLAVGSYCLVAKGGFSFRASGWILCAATACSSVPFYPRVIECLGRIGRATARPPAPTTRWAGQLWLASMGVWVCGGLSACALVRALGFEVPGADCLFIASASAAAWVTGFLVPWAPSGLGIREGVMSWLLLGVVPTPVAVVVVVAARLLAVFEDVVWAAVSLLLPARSN